MREILFRGKRIDNGEWVYGNLLKNIYGAQPAIVTEASVDDAVRLDFEYTHVIPESIGQYTGLTDKNGKKIFEGDICKHRSNYSGDFITSVVTYTDGCFLAMADENSGFNLSNKLEVIGNIHDNPELLGGADNGT